MTRRTNARIAGLAFLIYIAAAFTGMILENRAIHGEGTAAKLASLVQHASDLRAAVLLFMIGNFCALVLAVTLYAITRDQDPELALMVLVCRTAEGVVGGVSLSRTAGQLWLATAGGADASEPGIRALLLQSPSGSMEIGATFFAVGSLCFSYLLLRGRMVPVPLAWLGVLASILVVLCLPLQLAGLLRGPITDFIWLPMLAFEVPLGFWLIFKGVALPARRGSA
ncbi:MAG TPA: DUF4386 domain-containing protein [Thermoanaerobaculia bacterium]|nr:DUF4386 domain-containing protein [Thermoanaerobaculia bacterium]